MDPITLSLLIGGGISAATNIIGNIIGSADAKDKQKKADELMAQAMAEIEKVQDPELKNVYLDRLSQVGKLIPEVEQSLLTSSAQEQIKLDGTARKAQLNVLEQLAQRGTAGLTPQERAQRNESLRKADASKQSAVQSVLQNLQMRGQGGGGAATLALMQAAQTGADQDAVSMDRLAALSSERALQALKERANVSTTMEDRDYGRQKDLASARDKIAEFNQDVQSRNVNRRNRAEEANLSTAQSIADRNVGLTNEERMFNEFKLKQQKFDNQKALAGLKSGAYQTRAGQYQTQAGTAAQGHQQMVSGISQGIGGITNAVAGSMEAQANRDAYGRPKAKTQDVKITKPFSFEDDEELDFSGYGGEEA